MWSCWIFVFFDKLIKILLKRNELGVTKSDCHHKTEGKGSESKGQYKKAQSKPKKKTSIEKAAKIKPKLITNSEEHAAETPKAAQPLQEEPERRKESCWILPPTPP